MVRESLETNYRFLDAHECQQIHKSLVLAHEFSLSKPIVMQLVILGVDEFYGLFGAGEECTLFIEVNHGLDHTDYRIIEIVDKPALYEVSVGRELSLIRLAHLAVEQATC